MEKGRLVLTGSSLTKICASCAIEKDRSEFYTHKSTKDRLRSECKICWNGLSLTYYRANRPKRRAAARDYHYRSNYGITVAEFEEACRAQDFLCAICQQLEPLVQDHCHSSKKLRALLCAKCNHGLGSFKDNVTALQNAITYLEKYKE